MCLDTMKKIPESLSFKGYVIVKHATSNTKEGICFWHKYETRKWYNAFEPSNPNLPPITIRIPGQGNYLAGFHIWVDKKIALKNIALIAEEVWECEYEKVLAYGTQKFPHLGDVVVAQRRRLTRLVRKVKQR